MLAFSCAHFTRTHLDCHNQDHRRYVSGFGSLTYEFVCPFVFVSSKMSNSTPTPTGTPDANASSAVPPGLGLQKALQQSNSGGGGGGRLTRNLSPREVYSLLVHHGLKPEVAAPFLDHGIDSGLLQKGVEEFDSAFPKATWAEASVQETVQKVLKSTNTEIVASSVALDNLPICVVNSKVCTLSHCVSCHHYFEFIWPTVVATCFVRWSTWVWIYVIPG